ncbi:MAG: 3-oxoacyl-ACP reductase, partial [Actinomadura rubrobrunea]|nr:3-oxoacyl-ACP reductase [Actinomadura rubrobrunea]
SLWTHPQESVVAVRDGGWDADAIAAAWATTVGREPQTYGISAPKVPDDAREAVA